MSTSKQQKRCSTSAVTSFFKTCRLVVGFNTWLRNPGGSGKSLSQADQVTSKTMCCATLSKSNRDGKYIYPDLEQRFSATAVIS